MIKVLFFAQLREQLQCSELCVSKSTINTSAQLFDYLLQTHPHWREFLGNKKLLMAVNKALVKQEHVLQAGDEVAFFPPVTGG